MEERWKPENKDWVRHVPWNKGGDDPQADGEIPEGAESEPLPGEARGSGEPRVVVVNTRETAPREFYIKKRDLEAHGHTRGCAGCQTLIQGGTRQAHSAECRERFRRLMHDDEKVKRTQEKRKDYEDRMMAKELRKEAKRKKGGGARDEEEGGGRPD